MILFIYLFPCYSPVRHLRKQCKALRRKPQPNLKAGAFWLSPVVKGNDFYYLFFFYLRNSLNVNVTPQTVDCWHRLLMQLSTCCPPDSQARSATPKRANPQRSSSRRSWSMKECKIAKCLPILFNNLWSQITFKGKEKFGPKKVVKL